MIVWQSSVYYGNLYLGCNSQADKKTLENIFIRESVDFIFINRCVYFFIAQETFITELQEFSRYVREKQFLDRRNHFHLLELFLLCVAFHLQIVAILEMKHSRACGGSLKLQSDKNSNYALFSPFDSRIPRIMIPMNEVPPGMCNERQHSVMCILTHCSIHLINKIIIQQT